MPSPTNPTGREAFLRDLETIWDDPRIRRLARLRAGDPEIAEDALQEAFCAVARYGDPEKIEDLRKYFCRVLINQINRLLRLPAPALVDNFENVADACQDNTWGQPLHEPFDKTLCTHLLVRGRLRRLVAHRAYFIREMPGRSHDPSRYRALIVTLAERILAASVSGGMGNADVNSALRAEYPEWFNELGCGTANAHQRFKRAREDVRDLLQLIISREDLYS